MNGFTHYFLKPLLMLAILPGALIPPGSSQAGALPPMPAAVILQSEDPDWQAVEFTGCGVETSATLNDAYEQRVVELVNQERAAAGVPPLKRVSAMDDAGRYHAADMGVDNYFAHDSYNRASGTLTWKCSWDARISSYYTDWSWLGENIAAGASTPESAMSLWMGSTGHRANILNPDFSEIGVGYYSGSGTYFTYWVQDFGKRSNVYPLVINAEAGSTASTQVNLYIYGTWSEFRLRNDNQTWSAWRPFTNSSTWELPAQNGLHTVSVEMRSGTRLASSADTINLSLPSPPTLGNLPVEVLFTYNLPDQKLLPYSIQLTPLNITTADTLIWEISGVPDWLDVTQTQGSTPQSINLTPSVLNVESTTSYTATLTVTVLSPVNVAGAPFHIDLTLQVLSTKSGAIYLPVVVR